MSQLMRSPLELLPRFSLLQSWEAPDSAHLIASPSWKNRVLQTHAAKPSCPISTPPGLADPRVTSYDIGCHSLVLILQPSLVSWGPALPFSFFSATYLSFCHQNAKEIEVKLPSTINDPLSPRASAAFLHLRGKGVLP